jgi:hypothetical protein
MATWPRQLPPSRRALRWRRAGTRQAASPGCPARQQRPGHPALHRRDRSEQVWCDITAKPGSARHGAPGCDPAPQAAGPPAGEDRVPAGRGRQPGKRPAYRACYTPAASASTASGDISASHCGPHGWHGHCRGLSRPGQMPSPYLGRPALSAGSLNISAGARVGPGRICAQMFRFWGFGYPRLPLRSARRRTAWSRAAAELPLRVTQRPIRALNVTGVHDGVLCALLV